jgi:hypothetical protein
LLGDNAYAGRRHKIPQRNHRNDAVHTQMLKGVEDGDKTSGDRRCARPPVSLDDIAIDPNSALPQPLEIHHRARRPADQALDFMRPSANAPTR